ncbi:hypothetical protein [Methylobacterium sp. PvR107]|uniref:hypothetical protein n=1 Tax=Methylobacterium sp. PvR107 TaxID=2806597 RepID=UPI001AE8E323|nr:hypothetical protein [Methylobacterium sp. PvR107]MBP1179944.1 hypothetical protein [Methylobacterium sp. PvR107]
MSDEADPVLEAVSALRACGHTVEPWSDDFALWLIDRVSHTDSDLLALAIRLGLMDSPGGLQ